MSGIYAEAWQHRLQWLMSYVRPLAWMALALLVKLAKHLLALLIGFAISIPLMYLMFWVQDIYNLRF